MASVSSAGTFTSGGLITGLDSNTIISQLVSIYKQPETRMTKQITALQAQQSALRDMRTQLLSLQYKAQDFKFSSFFSYNTTTSESTVATAQATSENPVMGNFLVDITQLATATVGKSSAYLGASIDPAATLENSGISTTIQSGTFSINGVSFTVDPTTQSLNSVISAINSSAAGVTAAYDSVTDKVSLTNTTAASTAIINMGGSDDTSNLLDVLGLRTANQHTGATGSTTVASTGHLGQVNPATQLNQVRFASGVLTSESFTINGVSISVDPTTDSLSDVIGRINSSDAGVTASYDASTDGLRLVSKTLGSRTISFGTGGTNNLLKVTHLDTATQTAGSDAQYSVNGGPVQTSNTNDATDAISGVTVHFLSTGKTTIGINSNDDDVVTKVKAFLEAYNTVADKLSSLTATKGALAGDSSLTDIGAWMRTNFLSNVSGVSGSYKGLIDIGVGTGATFDSTQVAHLSLDEEKFRKALLDDRSNVKNLITNEDGTGVADTLYSYLNSATQITGFLNQRAMANGTIDQQIKDLNAQIDRMDERAAMYETRLRNQFTRLETMSSSMQSQASSLSRLGSL